MVVPADAAPSQSFSSESDLPPRDLLFGEIDSTGSRSLRTNASICNLTFTSNSTFLKFWLLDQARERFLSFADEQSLANLRLVCVDFSSRAAPFLFKEVGFTFRAGTFTRPARVAALERIGSHVRSVQFKVAHSEDTCLPPLVDPLTGEQVSFEYNPRVAPPKTLIEKVKSPKYGSWEVTDLLVKQYPPLFHAATNVAAFVRCFQALPNLSHLTLRCPGQGSTHPGRRSIVDYVLISLRVALEQAPLVALDSLTLSPIHPDGLLYLQPILGFGASPKSVKRWAQITTLEIHMDNPSSLPLHCSHHKLLLAFLRHFSMNLRQFIFRWNGSRGPSPVSLDSEPGLWNNAANDAPVRRLRFYKLTRMELENAVTDATQISTFISRHRRTLAMFNFQEVKLRSGSWDDALAPLTKMSGGSGWKSNHEDVMEVPLMLSSENLREEVKPLQVSTPQLQERSSLGRWLSRSRAAKMTSRVCGRSEHLKSLLRCSVLPWR